MARPLHLDSPLEIDFTDLRIEKSIRNPYLDIVVYVLACNPVSDQSVEGFVGKEPGEPVKRLPVKPRSIDNHGDSSFTMGHGMYSIRQISRVRVYQQDRQFPALSHSSLQAEVTMT